MSRLSNSEFLSKAAELIAKSNGTSSVYLSQKRLTYSANEAQIPVEPVSEIDAIKNDNKSYQLLIRLTDGNKDKKSKNKISTVVDSTDLDSFWLEYSNVLKNGFVGLKKKDKKKKKKQSKK